MIELLLQACLQGSAMALAVIAARAILSRHLPGWVFPALWTAVLARFLLPVDLSTRRLLSGSAGEVGQASGTVESPSGLLAESARAAAEAVLPQSVPWGLVWGVGSVAALTALTVLHGIQSRALRGARPAAPNPVLGPWLASHRLRRGLRVLESRAVRTPVARGLLHPSIVVPQGYLDGDRAKVEAALEHEFAHIRRFDPTVRAAALLVACIYWFNPLAWLAYLCLSRDQELACDESALRRLGDGARRSYAEALLDAAAAALPKARVCEAGFGQEPLEGRVRRVVFPTRRRPALAALAAAAACLAVAGAAWYAAPPPVETVSVGDCTLELPSYWRDRVEVSFGEDGSSASVHLAGHPELYLVELVEVGGADSSRTEIPYSPYRMLWSGTSSSGQTYELWGLCYAGMSTNDDWAAAPAANPRYPGAEAEIEAVDLSTGGAVSVDEARLCSEVDDAWFDFYLEEVVTGVDVS